MKGVIVVVRSMHMHLGVYLIVQQLVLSLLSSVCKMCLVLELGVIISGISLLSELDGAIQRLIILWLVLDLVQNHLKVNYGIFILDMGMVIFM